MPAATASAPAGGGGGSVLDLQQMLTAAEPRGPAGLPQPDAGAVLALACHCLMVQSGFKVTRPGASAAGNKWLPAPKWATEFKDEWVFRYSAPGKRNELALHCSLQRASGRMLVHGIEVLQDATAPRNSQLLGLMLAKYVPDASSLRGPSWEGVVANEAALLPMLQQHIVAPLLEAAADMPAGQVSAELAEWSDDAAGHRSWLAWLGRSFGGGAEHSSVVVPAVLVTAVALGAVAAYVVMTRKGKK